MPWRYGFLVLGRVLDWVKDNGNQKSGEDGPGRTLDCARAHLGVSKIQGSYRMFRLGPGCPEQLVNGKKGL